MTEKINKSNIESKIINKKAEKLRTSWLSITGWAAAIILGTGLFLSIQEKTELESKINVAETNKDFLEQQIEIADSNLKDAKSLITILRDKDILIIPLNEQTVYPEAYAKVYWDKSEHSIYLDVESLPKPPEDKVYKIWSLTLNPLTPTSLGNLDSFASNDNNFFAIKNTNKSEAFGITLEPAGKSASPTLEQFYCLGTVAAVNKKN